MFRWIRALADFIQPEMMFPAIDRLAQLATERSLPAVRERLTLDCTTMGTAELRGYVRARAWSIVRMQSQQLAAERNVSAAAAETLMSRTLDRTTLAILRQPLRQPVMPLPAPHVQLRIAG